MIRFVRLLVAMAVAAGVLAAAAPARAHDCAADTWVFSYYASDIPGGPSPYDRTPTASVTPHIVGCAGGPAEVHHNTDIIYPGSTFISSLLLEGTSRRYCFDGDLADRCGAAKLILFTDYHESDLVAVNPAALGCVRAWFEGHAPVVYCTADSLAP
ncbi:MAG TPA: hypothetical protein VNE62_06590 [Actinomycetota bacterium]|nr:hypothetical protein [Actinomycetota bacterium]